MTNVVTLNQQEYSVEPIYDSKIVHWNMNYNFEEAGNDNKNKRSFFLRLLNNTFFIFSIRFLLGNDFINYTHVSNYCVFVIHRL